MYRKLAYFILVLLFVIPVPSLAQCKDALCSSLQDSLDSASIDFRGYISHTLALPSLSTESTKVPCSMSTWANNVPMLICYSQVPLGSATNWYARAMDNLKQLNPSWSFTIKTPGDDRYVDAGPPHCEPTPTEGPYIGQCPLRLEVRKQSDGSAKIYLLVNSFNSPFLMHHTMLSPTPAKSEQAAPAGVSTNGISGCDEFCQGLKRAFEARANNFAGANPAKLPGAKDCLVKKSPAPDAGSEFVCYWQEASSIAAETRFRDLVSRLQILLPSNWSMNQGNELDEQTGAALTAWNAAEPGTKHDIRVYLSSDAVGLHISASK